MAIKLGEKAPNFVAQSTKGRIDLYRYLGNSWGILFSHPADFTPVCTTELGAVARLVDDFERRNTKVIALSVDPLDSHLKWVEDINSTQNVGIDFPIIADHDMKVAILYDMINPKINEMLTVRSVFIIAPDKTVKLTLTYPPSTGRNFAEIIRVLDSLQLTEDYKVATPADWRDGDDVVILPSISDEEIPENFSKGHTEIRPYLRITPQPNK